VAGAAEPAVVGGIPRAVPPLARWRWVSLRGAAEWLWSEWLWSRRV